MNFDDIKEKMEQVDWSDVLLKSATPALITFGIGFVMAYSLQKNDGPTTQKQKLVKFYQHKICLLKLLT